MPSIWKKWCRLCAKENGDDIDVFIKNENFLSITEAIQKFLCIAINSFDEAPTKICNICHENLTDLITFWIQSSKVQEMFSELQFNDKFEILPDLKDLRLKYGLKSMVDCNDHEYLNNDKKSVLLIQDQSDENIECKENIILKNDKNNSLIITEQKQPQEQDENPDLNEIEMNDLKLLNVNISETFNGSTNILPNCDNLNNIKNKNDINNCITYLDSRKILQYKYKSKRFKRKDHHKNKLTEYSKDPVAFCDICQQSFYNKGGYTFHLKSKHSIINEPIQCKFCKKTFKAISDHQKHETTHLPPDERKSYPCTDCGKKFFSEGNLNSHVRVVHIREKSFICEECGKSFVTVDGLNSHKLVHTDEKPFQCPKCPKSFKRLPTLKLHIDSHEESKYICSICGQQLNSKALLRRHMVVHSDEKKYKCNFCEKEFKRPDAFKHHLILHTGLKPYECPFCEQTFANGSNCRKHQKTSHPQELAIAEEAGLRRVCRNVPKIEQLRAVNEGAAVDNSVTI